MSTDCCSQPNLMAVEQARDILVNSVRPIGGFETIPLVDAAGRVLAEPLLSPVDLPSCDNSAMDGYALRYVDLASGEPLKLTGKSFAGAPFEGHLSPGGCVRIMTGAALPQDADTVVMQEHVKTDGDLVFINKGVSEGDHIRRRGEDVSVGAELLAAGQKITTAHIALAAAAGIGSVTAVRRPVIALLSTGDELRQAGESLATGDIYDSNRIALKSALQQLDLKVLDLGILPDDRGQITAALSKAADEADAIITSGGVSVGEADYTREIVKELGDISLWKIAMKPGKPFAFGHVKGIPFFGLPGNPVSALVTFYQLVIPALTQLRGLKPLLPPTLHARLASPVKKRPGRTDFQRGIYSQDGNGELQVAPTGHQGSHILSGLADANCFIVLPCDSGDQPTGSQVEITPLQAPLG